MRIRRTFGLGLLIVGCASSGAEAIEPLAGQLACAADGRAAPEVGAASTPSLFRSFLDTDVAAGAMQDTMPAGTAMPAGADDYVGGRGLITTEGPSGMFLNPTSGTARQGGFAAQYCAAFLKVPGGATNHAHGAMISYGITDWLEVGGVALVLDLDDVNHNIGVGGPFFRVRLLRDESWWPELSVGAVGRFGYRAIESETVFVAASKRFALDEGGFFRAFRLHVGFREIWQDASFAEANGSIVYTGGELEFPCNVFLVGEVSNKDDVYAHTPFSVGVQIRSPQLALSIAGIQTGGLEQISLYAGIGIDY